MQMNHVKLLVTEERLNSRVERHVEGHADSAAVCGNRYSPPDSIESVTHFQTALAAPRRKHGHVLPVTHELRSQVGDVFQHPAGMRRVVWRNKGDLHRSEPSRIPAPP